MCVKTKANIQQIKIYKNIFEMLYSIGLLLGKTLLFYTISFQIASCFIHSFTNMEDGRTTFHFICILPVFLLPSTPLSKGSMLIPSVLRYAHLFWNSEFDFFFFLVCIVFHLSSNVSVLYSQSAEGFSHLTEFLGSLSMPPMAFVTYPQHI